MPCCEPGTEQDDHRTRMEPVRVRPTHAWRFGNNNFMERGWRNADINTIIITKRRLRMWVSNENRSLIRENTKCRLMKNGDFIDLFFDGRFIFAILEVDLFLFMESGDTERTISVTRDIPANMDTLVYDFNKAQEYLKKRTEQWKTGNTFYEEGLA